jgi:hypothetical protein
MINFLRNAYENEIELENCIKIYNNYDKTLPSFKVLKTQVIKNKIGILFYLFYFIYAIYVFFRLIFSFIILVLLLVFSLVRLNKLGADTNSDFVYFPTDLKAISLIQNVFEQIGSKDKLELKNRLTLFNLVRRLSFIELFEAGLSWIYFYYSILLVNKNRFLIYLNSVDSLFLVLLIKYLEKNKDQVVVTDDQCQRWAYLISNISNNAIFVQHGYIYDFIKFPFKFGNVNTYFIRDMSFIDNFSIYYNVNKFEILKRKINFQNTGFDFALFLASSSPSIDQEIIFLDIFTKNFDIPIIIKKHPIHNYDSNKLKLLYSFANYVCKHDEYPICNIFVSYSSFMEFDYKSNSIETYSLINYCNYNDLIYLISHNLKTYNNVRNVQS